MMEQSRYIQVGMWDDEWGGPTSGHPIRTRIISDGAAEIARRGNYPRPAIVFTVHYPLKRLSAGISRYSE